MFIYARISYTPITGVRLPGCAIGAYSHHVDTPKNELDDTYNSAIAAVLRARKAELRPRLTFEALEATTGIKLRQLKYLFNGERAIHMADFCAITSALGLDPGWVIQSAADRVENTSA